MDAPTGLLAWPVWFTPGTVVVLVSAVVVVAILWGMRLREIARQRAETAALQGISEEIFTARNAPELHGILDRSLPSVLDVGHVVVYAHNQAGNSLIAMAPRNANPGVVLLDQPKAPDGPRQAFLERRQIYVEDPNRFPNPVLWVPMTAEGETTGVLECRFSSFNRRPDVTARANLQHLANHVALAIVLIEQRQLREDLLRGERLSAAVELISGIAFELRSPIERIRALAQRGAAAGQLPPEALAQLEAETSIANSVLNRLVSFGKGAQTQPAAFDLNALLESLVAFRADPWRLLIIEPVLSLAEEQLPVLGVRGQIEQAFLGLIVQAEQSLRNAETKTLTLRSEVQGQTGVVWLQFPWSPTGTEAEGEPGAMSLGVARGIVESHSGRLNVTTAGGFRRFEVVLPLSGPAEARREAATSLHRPTRPLTLLVASASEDERRRVVELLSDCPHRAVPASSLGEALELMERLKFDGLVLSASLSTISWPALMERVRPLGGDVVVLEADGVAPPPAEIPLVSRPFDRDGLNSALARMHGGAPW